MNNAVARTAGLLAVAVVPVAAGIGGTDYQDPEAFAPGFRTAAYLMAGLLVVGGVLAAVTVTVREDVDMTRDPQSAGVRRPAAAPRRETRRMDH